MTLGSVRREVPLRKRATGARLQASLEAKRRRRIGKLERHDQAPWPVVDSASGRTVVVPIEPILDVRREAHVVTFMITLAAEDVDESTRYTLHAVARGRRRAARNPQEIFGSGTESNANVAGSARWSGGESCRSCGPPSLAHLRPLRGLRRDGFGETALALLWTRLKVRRRAKPHLGCPPSPASRASARHPSLLL